MKEILKEFKELLDEAHGLLDESGTTAVDGCEYHERVSIWTKKFEAMMWYDKDLKVVWEHTHYCFNCEQNITCENKHLPLGSWCEEQKEELCDPCAEELYKKEPVT